MNSIDILTSQIIPSAQTLLQNFAIDGSLNLEAIALAFGNNVDINELQRLEQEFTLGDFSSLPIVEILTNQELNGSLGAYASQLDRIFIFDEFLNNASEAEIVAVVLEEIGHAIDRKINLVDSLGDEGYIFSALVRGVDLTPEQIASAQQEDDRIEIVVDGQIVLAEGATIVVDTLVDENDGVGVGTGTSLREALNAIAGGDTITFDNGIANGTITLAGSELVVDKSVTIDGDTDNITVDGNNVSRVFNISDSTTTVQTVNIDSLTIKGGSTSGDGGGIFNNEHLTLSNSTVSENSANNNGGGIFNLYGTASLSNINVSGNSANNNGGGIFNRYETVSISNSTVSGNSANKNGGGIFNIFGTASISNSNVSTNSASSLGGGIYNIFGTTSISNSTVSTNSASSRGGGIFNVNGTASISNSTVSTNSASYGGGIFNVIGTTSISNSTVSTNSASYGGGIFNSGESVNISSTIVADNTATSSGNDIENNATLNASHSLIEDSNGNSLVDGVDNNIIGQDPQLDPNGLQDNGGITETIALLPNSPAIDAGNNPDSLINDQRGTGFTREENSLTDIGAYEFQPILSGNNGNDTLTGTIQADLILGHRGSDRIIGRAGDDSLDGATEADFISAGAGDDTLNGSAGRDELYGRIGNDLLLGGLNKDRIFGGFDDDTLDGGTNDDFLFGAQGDDLLMGGTGNDILRGGDGNDIFFLAAASGQERIVDYEDGIDKFKLGSSLSFTDLTIRQNIGSEDTLIVVTSTNEILARVVTENAANITHITQNDFI